eukprot:2225270-Pyramimonas_sp.AAC.1
MPRWKTNARNSRIVQERNFWDINAANYRYCCVTTIRKHARKPSLGFQHRESTGLVRPDIPTSPQDTIS